MNNIFLEINNCINAGKKAALCIVVNTNGSTPRKAGAKMIVYENGDISGTIGGGELENFVIQKALESIKTKSIFFIENNLLKEFNMQCGGNVRIYIEPLKPESKLYIFGAGHIGKILAEIATKTDFNVTVIDNRKGIFNQWDNNSFNLIEKEFDTALNDLKFDENTYLCTITQNHFTDAQVLSYCAKQKFAFLGMIGSKGKFENFKKQHATELSVEQFNRIECPLGINIKAQTPAEIAVSILARLIEVRAES